METLEKTENKLAKIQPDQLESVVKNSGLAIIEAEEIKTAYLPFLIRLTLIQDQAGKINFENPTELDEKISRELRLLTVKVRTDAEKLKDEQKRVDILRSKVKQDSFNLISSSCKLAEEVFFNVEKAREIAEKKRKAQLKTDREEKLSPYTEAAFLYPLGEMSDEQFNELYSGLRISHENKLAAERKAEEDRIAKEKADAEEREEQRLENIRLQKEAKEKEKQLEAEREKVRKDAEEKEKALQAEREKVRKENEERERLAEIERKKQSAILAKQKEEADKREKELLAKAEAEKIQRENIEAEIRRKKAAEEKAKREQEAKALAEKRAKAAEEKKAFKAPDKVKLLAFGQALNDVPRPDIKSIEAAEIMANINGLLVKLNNYIVEKANKL